MYLQGRNLLLVMAFAGAAAIAAFTQVQPAQAQSAAALKEFSGIWTHPSLGFELPLSGPGPVVNKSRLKTGASNFDQLVGDYTNPILKPAAAEIVRKKG